MHHRCVALLPKPCTIITKLKPIVNHFKRFSLFRIIGRGIYYYFDFFCWRDTSGNTLKRYLVICGFESAMQENWHFKTRLFIFFPFNCPQAILQLVLLPNFWTNPQIYLFLYIRPGPIFSRKMFLTPWGDFGPKR